MKQKYIMAFFLSAVLVLTLSGTDSVFADYDEEYEEDYDESERYADSEHEEDHDKECEKEDSENYDKYKKEGS